MPRKSIGERPMTDAERQARSRAARACGTPADFHLQATEHAPHTTRVRTRSGAFRRRSGSTASCPRAAEAASARTPTSAAVAEEELDLLSQRWERARKGEGQLALVVGEPGIGKSRLIQEFRARLGRTPHTFVEWSSSQLLNAPAACRCLSRR